MYKNYYSRGYRYSSTDDNYTATATTTNGSATQQQIVTSANASNIGIPTVEEQLRTIYIGNLSEDVPDSLIQTALKHIPGLEMWVRFTTTSGELTDYGFARYATAGEVSVALDVLPNIKIRDRQFQVSCEENTRRWLSSLGPFNAQSIARRPLTELEKMVQGTFTMWLQNNPVPKKANVVAAEKVPENEDGDVMELYRKSLKKETPPGVASDEKETVFDEIIRFRELSIKLEKARLAEDFDYEAKRTDNSKTRQDYEEDEYNFAPEDESDADDSELEQRRLKREQEEQDRRFKEQERRWIARERTRANALQREKTRSETFDKKLQQTRQLAMQEYEEFNDDVERARKNRLYYSDHAAWFKRRKDAREREIQRDEEDRQAEELERKELAKNPQAANEGGITIQLPSVAAPASSPAPPSAPAPVPASAVVEQKQLPDVPEELFALTVSWDKLDEGVIEKLRPTVINGIMECIGVQEDELVDYVLDHLREHKPAPQLVEEMSEVLEEDAQSMVVTVWKELHKQLG